MRRFLIVLHRTSHRLTSLCLALLLLCPLLSSCQVTLSREDLSDGDSDSENIPVIAPSDEDPPKEPEDTRPRVALTFDDGPNHYQGTKPVVDELCKYGYTATFFVLGERIPGGDTLSYMVEKGMEIGIHGDTHDVYYDNCTEEDFFAEMNRTADAILMEVPDYEIKLMRPIGGRISYDIQAVCPYSVIMWSNDSLDYENKYYTGITDEECERRVNTIVENVLSQLKEGDIILMHDIYQSTYDATVLLLQRLNEMGYNVVSVSELLGDELQPGEKYYSKS